jgi:RNase adaptor protein for sRNA GlmZ degradation
MVEGLTVDVCSFSYRCGLPEDTSGNGGGFVFDCRAIHNPGRYDAYKPFTGRDASVVAFLDATEGMALFLDKVYALVDQSIERYIARRFTHLSVAFGCTGGQHRSVYAADHLAVHLSERWPQITVRLTHREQPQLNG